MFFQICFNCIAYCNSSVCERLGWLARSESYIWTTYSNAFTGVILEDCIKTFAFLCQDAIMVDQYPRDASRRKEFFEQGYTVGNCSGH